MSDPVIVLDVSNRVIDVNSAALKFLDQKLKNIIGLHSGQVLAAWPDLIELLKQPELRTIATIRMSKVNRFN